MLRSEFSVKAGVEEARWHLEAAAVQAEAAAAHAQRRARRSEADVQALVGEMTILEMALAIEMGREMRRLLDSPGPVASEAGVTPAVAAVERLRLPGGGVPASASA